MPTRSLDLQTSQVLDGTYFDLECALLDLKTRQLEEVCQPVYIPPMAKANLQARDDDLFSLIDKAQEFLTSNRQVMLILGDSGAGKSTFNKHLEVELLTAYKRGGPIPLFISLPAVDRLKKDLVAEHLRMNNFSEEQIKELRQYRQFVLICDGYDESQLTINLHTTNRFNRPGQWNVKMLISCRTQSLSQEYHSRFMPEGKSHYTRQAADLFQEAVIAPFSKKQIENYIEQYVPLEPRTWTTMDYMDSLTAIPNLMDLVKNPFLLTLSLEALPGVTEGRQNLSLIQISRVQLYDIFVRHWLDVNSRRLLRNTLCKEDRETLEQLLEAGFTSMGIDFSTRLATAIFEHQDGNPVVQYVHLKDKKSWRADFFGPDPEIRLLRESSPLTRTGSQFRFLHRSILEYFLSCAVFHPNHLEDNIVFPPQCDSRFYCSSDQQILNPESVLFNRNLLPEPSVIQFLCERAKQHSDFQKRLLFVIKQSKSDASVAIAAANAITILVRAGVRFNSADLRGIRIPGADLSDGQFDSTQFRGAELTGVTFSRSWLRQADFSDALTEGVHYGELPYLREDDDCIDSCAFSPDGRMFAVSLRRGDIEMYDTTSWTKIHGIGRRFHDVWGIAFSPDKEHIVSRSHNNTLRLWDITSGKTLLAMQGDNGYVRSVAFSPCGKQIASGCSDGTVWLWSAETGEEIFVMKGHTDKIRAVIYAPDGQRMISGSDNEMERVFNLETGEETLVMTSTDEIRAVKYAPDGRRLVSGSENGVVQFWDPKTGNPGPICNVSKRVYSLDYSPDGQRVVSGHGKEGIYLWDADCGDLLLTIHNAKYGIRCAAFSPDGQWIISSVRNHIVHMYDSSTGLLVCKFSGHTSCVNFCTFSPDGLQIASRDADGIVRLWDANSRTSTPPNSGRYTGGVSTVAYSLDGQIVLSCIRGQGIQRRNASTGVYEPIAIKFMEDVQSFALSPDGRQIATATYGGIIQLYNGKTGTVERTLVRETDSADVLVYSPCGRWILSSHWDKSVRLWDLHDAASQSHVVCKQAHVWEMGLRANIYIAFSPIGRQFAVGSREGHIQLFSPQSKNPCSPFMEMTCISVCSLVFSPDGLRVVVGLESGTLHIWNLQSETKDVELEGHASKVSCIAFSLCGRWLLSGSKDRTIRIWQLGPGEADDSWSCAAVVRGCSESITCVAWNPAVPMEFVSGCRDGSVRVWKISIGDDREVEPVRMLWGNDVGRLCVSGLTFKGAIGLSPMSQRLLMQRGAEDGGMDLEGDEIGLSKVGDESSDENDTSSEENDTSSEENDTSSEENDTSSEEDDTLSWYDCASSQEDDGTSKVDDASDSDDYPNE